MKGMNGGIPQFGGQKHYGSQMGRAFGPRGFGSLPIPGGQQALAGMQNPNAGNATWQQGMRDLGGTQQNPMAGPQIPNIQLNAQDQQQQMLGQQQMAAMLRSGQTGGFGA